MWHLKTVWKWNLPFQNCNIARETSAINLTYDLNKCQTEKLFLCTWFLGDGCLKDRVCLIVFKPFRSWTWYWMCFTPEALLLCLIKWSTVAFSHGSLYVLTILILLPNIWINNCLLGTPANITCQQNEASWWTGVKKENTNSSLSPLERAQSSMCCQEHLRYVIQTAY